MRIGVCSLQRNRAPYIKEWVLFHFLLGVRFFYIGLHECDDNSDEILIELSRKINITIVKVPEKTKTFFQIDFYQFIFDRYKNEVDWMAFIDGDEFLYPTQEHCLQDVLSKIQNNKRSALAVYWSCFGSSFHEKEPEGLVTENFKYCAPVNFGPNRHIKSIVNTARDRLVRVENPHLFITSFGTYDEQDRLITEASSDHLPTYEQIGINHYVCQSREFFVKTKQPQSSSQGFIQRSEEFWLVHDRNEILCKRIDRFIPRLKELYQSLTEPKNSLLHEIFLGFYIGLKRNRIINLPNDYVE